MIPAPPPPEEDAPGGPVWASPLRREADAAAEISDAVATVPGVAAMSAGEFGHVGTFAAGRSVPGVRIDDDQIQVHIVARYGISLPSTVAGISAAVAPLLGGRSLQVAVQDILLPGERLVESAVDPAPADQAD